MGSKNFFYRVNPNEVLAELVFIENREEWLLNFFVDLKTDDPEKARSDLAARIIQEAHDFRKKRSKAGKASSMQRSTNVEHMLNTSEQCKADVEQCSTSSISISSTEALNNKTNSLGDESPTKKRSTLFFPPSSPEVQAYMDEIGYDGNGASFCDYYQAKGWMIGKNKMKDWKAAVRTWKQNGYSSKKGDKRNELSEEEYDNYRLGLLGRM